MNNKLIAFVEQLLNDPETMVTGNSAYDKLGFVINNNKWNCKINVFSDRANGYYFELCFNNHTDGQKNWEGNPTFRTQEISSIKTLLENIVRHYEMNQNCHIIDANQYLEIFHKALRKEPLPSNFSININNYAIQIFEGESLYGELLKKDILDFNNNAYTMHEPMSYQGIVAREVSDQKRGLHLIFPKYKLSEYPLLESSTQLKNQSTLTYSVDDWLQNIKTFDNVPQSPVHATIDYINLKNELNPIDEENNTKKRPKL